MEIGAANLDSRAAGMLQFGHGGEAVEIYRLFAVRRRPVRASIRPRRRSRGDPTKPAKPTVTPEASIRPRRRSRGDAVAGWRGVVVWEASIRPRRRSRGDSTVVAPGLRRNGRFNSATAAKPWRFDRMASHCQLKLSFNSATAAKPWRCADMSATMATRTRFNSATAAKPWRCGPGPARSERATSFNSATAAKPWRLAGLPALGPPVPCASIRPRRRSRGDWMTQPHYSHG